MYVCMYLSIYLSILTSISLSLSLYIYIYIYIYIYKLYKIVNFLKKYSTCETTMLWRMALVGFFPFSLSPTFFFFLTLCLNFSFRDDFRFFFLSLIFTWFIIFIYYILTFSFFLLFSTFLTYFLSFLLSSFLPSCFNLFTFLYLPLFSLFLSFILFHSLLIYLYISSLFFFSFTLLDIFNITFTGKCTTFILDEK